MFAKARAGVNLAGRQNRSDQASNHAAVEERTCKLGKRVLQ